MLTILGSFIGFLTSLFPSIVGLWRQKQDQRHELALFDKQIQLARHEINHRLVELDNLALIKDTERLGQPLPVTRIPWVDALNASVRPLLTYVFFFLFCGIKVAKLFTFFHLLSDTTVWQAFNVIWQEEDQALFAAIMSFWFGYRALQRGAGSIGQRRGK